MSRGRRAKTTKVTSKNVVPRLPAGRQEGRNPEKQALDAASNAA